MTQSYPTLVEVTIRRGQRLRLLRWLCGYGGGGHLYAPIVDCSQTRGVQDLAYCASMQSPHSQLTHARMTLAAFGVATGSSAYATPIRLAQKSRGLPVRPVEIGAIERS